jgi:hypothetical protein
VPLVHPLLGPDAVELDLGGVVGLDRVPEVGVDLLYLGEDLLGVGLLRIDRRLRRRRSGEAERRRRGGQQDEDRVTSSRSDAYPRLGPSTGRSRHPAPVTRRGL